MTLGCLGTAIVPSVFTALTNAVAEQAQHRGSGRLTASGAESPANPVAHRGSGRVDDNDLETQGWVAWRGSGRVSDDAPNPAQA
ncbi:MAG: hypothetical protein O3C67_05265 [Cyanobacteria bacterium]|nr:hypothetical protein [Cyanobacteriota bacterium]MEB3268676.1 hypothetical protein [Leptolyngbya sp.]